MLRVGRGRHAFDNADFIAGFELLGEICPHLSRTLRVIRADKRHVQVFRLEHVRIEPVIDIHHDDPCIHGLLDDRDQRLRIGRGNHERIDLRDDHLLHDANLVRGIGFVLDAVGDQVELVCIVFLVILGAGFHGQEKLVRQRLHDERDLRLM